MDLMDLMDKMDKSLLRGIRLQCNLICGILFSGSNYFSGPAGRQSRFFVDKSLNIHYIIRQNINGKLFQDMAELHILNGDNALSCLQKCGFEGNSLVWRETYIEGPLPDTDDLHVFRTARAGFLIQFAELKDINFNRMYQHLKNGRKCRLRVLQAYFSMISKATQDFRPGKCRYGSCRFRF